MTRSFRTSTRLAAFACAVFFSGTSLAASADQPSYAQTGVQDETIQGTIYQVIDRYTLTLQDDRGFIDNITLHRGTVITPTGLGLGSGQVATLLGHTTGKTFEADEIDVDPSSISSGQSVLPGGDYNTTFGYGADYPAYAFGYDPSYSAGALYFGGSSYYGGGYYAPTGYYPGYGNGYGNGYGRGGSYAPPNGAGQNPSGQVDQTPRQPVRVHGANPPPGYYYPTGGSRIVSPGYRAAPPVYRSAPIYRGNPAPQSAPQAPRNASAPTTSRR